MGTLIESPVSSRASLFRFVPVEPFTGGSVCSTRSVTFPGKVMATGFSSTKDMETLEPELNFDHGGRALVADQSTEDEAEIQQSEDQAEESLKQEM